LNLTLRSVCLKAFRHLILIDDGNSTMISMVQTFPFYYPGPIMAMPHARMGPGPKAMSHCADSSTWLGRRHLWAIRFNHVVYQTTRTLMANVQGQGEKL
jgi:hypothetical protein